MDRFDKFTDRARKVLTLALEEAQRFDHNYKEPGLKSHLMERNNTWEMRRLEAPLDGQPDRFLLG